MQPPCAGLSHRRTAFVNRTIIKRLLLLAILYIPRRRVLGNQCTSEAASTMTRYCRRSGPPNKSVEATETPQILSSEKLLMQHRPGVRLQPAPPGPLRALGAGELAGLQFDLPIDQRTTLCPARCLQRHGGGEHFPDAGRALPQRRLRHGALHERHLWQPFQFGLRPGNPLRRLPLGLRIGALPSASSLSPSHTGDVGDQGSDRALFRSIPRAQRLACEIQAEACF